MHLVTLVEFQEATGLSDGALVRLLAKNVVPCSIDEDRGLVIDLDNTELSALVKSVAAREKDILLQRKRLIEERFSRIISDNLEDIAREAIAAFLTNSSKKPVA